MNNLKLILIRNIALVTLDHSVYKQIIAEIIRWNGIIRHINAQPIATI